MLKTEKKVQNIDTINAITEFSITLRTFRVQTWFYKVQKEQMRKTSLRMICIHSQFLLGYLLQIQCIKVPFFNSS